jgi:hypothetical protein
MTSWLVVSDRGSASDVAATAALMLAISARLASSWRVGSRRVAIADAVRGFRAREVSGRRGPTYPWQWQSRSRCRLTALPVHA